MELVFYLLQLLMPEQLSEPSQKAYISSLQSVYESYHTQVYLEKETSCLSRILYNETKGEPLQGSKLVAQTVINRVKHKDYPNSVCENLMKRNAYSFLNPKAKDKKRVYPKYFTEIADKALKGEYNGLIDSRVLYFKRCQHPSSFFDTKLKMVKRVGQHCFYRERGVI